MAVSIEGVLGEGYGSFGRGSERVVIVEVDTLFAAGVVGDQGSFALGLDRFELVAVDEVSGDNVGLAALCLVNAVHHFEMLGPIKDCVPRYLDALGAGVQVYAVCAGAAARRLAIDEFIAGDGRPEGVFHFDTMAAIQTDDISGDVELVGVFGVDAVSFAFVTAAA